VVDLDDALAVAETNSYNMVVRNNGIIVLLHNGLPVVGISPETKTGYFHGIYARTALVHPDLCPLAEYLLAEGCKTNLKLG